MKIGILGFHKVGKTTLFNTLTGSSIEVDKFSPPSPKPNIGVAHVKDPRLDRVAAIVRPQKTTPATFEYVDFPAIKKGAGRESLELSEFKYVDAIAHVVRAFPDDEIVHPEGTVDPLRDVENMELEFLLADSEILTKRIQKLKKEVQKIKDKELTAELDLLTRCEAELENEKPLRQVELTEEASSRLNNFALLSQKPVIHILNISEEEIQNVEGLTSKFSLETFESKPKTAISMICAKIEMEIAQLPPDDAKEFMDELGLQETSAERIIGASYRLLDVITIFTANEKEARAWSIERGTEAVKAAGKIHSDMERGFIRAEVISFEELDRIGSFKKAKEEGILRLEGKDYIVRDGDVIQFRFHV